MDKLSRSLLFVPGDRPDRFIKAINTGADEIIIDLEDAVSPESKAFAREATAAWLVEGNTAGVRINAADTDWFSNDLHMLKTYSTATVMLAKADRDSIGRVVEALPGRRVIALVETVKGYMELRQLAATSGVVRIAFGSVDFGVESGIADEADAMTAVRTQIVLESCYAGLQAPIDGVSVNFKDEQLMQCDAARTRQLGFGGKLCIHPKQVAIVNAAYKPTFEQVDWAKRVMSAFEASAGGATTVDGKMIDKPVVEQARTILAEACE